MKTIYLFLTLTVAFLAPIQAQTMKELHNLGDFNRKLLAASAATESIESSFTQVKFLDVLNESIVSKGTFYFKKTDKICLDYRSPMAYLMVINGHKIKIVADGKKSLMNLKSNQMMNEVQTMMTACMVGDLSKMSANYQLQYFEDATHYLIKIKPLSKAVQAYIKQIQIKLNKKEMSVDTLRISETATNYTEYTFSNKKFNTLKDDQRFNVR
ncbi:MAG: outer membrane lipoprotein carrier protein LolA [Bacteroidia bacterium]|nr:outer membrane lipoprotein carrier protein LolA [Bacteroidia bacterium]